MMLKKFNIDLKTNRINLLKIVALLVISLISCNEERQLKEDATHKECKTVSTDLKKCKIYDGEILKSEGFYFKGQKVDYHKYFDHKGNIISVKDFVYLGSDSIFLNQEIFFDKKGDTIKSNSYYYSINKLNDNVIKGDSIILDINVHVPKQKKSKYKLEIQLDNPENIDEILVFVSDNLNRQIVLKPETIGEKNIQGIILVGEFQKNNLEENNSPENVKKFYFNFSYTVEKSM